MATRKKQLLSAGIALVSFAALSAVNLVIFRGMSERSRLESRNDGEQTFSILFTSARSYDDFGSAIEATPSLKKEILGLGFYDGKGSSLLRWGAAPEFYVPPAFVDADVRNDMARVYIENDKNDSLILVLKSPTDRPPPPPGPRDSGGPGPFRSHVFEMLRNEDVIYLEIRQPAFWRGTRLRAALFPIAEIILAGLVIFVRFLAINNLEYRERIEQQRSFVTLGKAASTLAHEIKNPLLAIRLQTSIIARTIPGQARRELSIIDAEVERLSMITNRISDFLRDPLGNPTLVYPVEAASEVGARLCGRSIVSGRSNNGLAVRIDPERLRSILENLVRNALESGGDEAEVIIDVAKSDGVVRIDVLDRGRGVPPACKDRVFDPFFTTKSRGSGIGLAICRRFVEAAGGSISLDDRPRGGIRARVLLPEAHA